MKCKDLGLVEKYLNEVFFDFDQDGMDIYEEVERNVECILVEEKVIKIVEDYFVYMNVRDDGQVFRFYDVEYLICLLNDELMYFEMKLDC